MCLISTHARLKQQYKELETQLNESEKKVIDLETDLQTTNQENRKLHTELALTINPPTLESCGTIDINEMSSILLDKLEEMKDDKADLLLADIACKVYKKDDVVKFLGLDETNKITYIAEFHDCDDFAAELYGKGFGLLWTAVHALSWFVDENNTLWFVEPQNDEISQTLESWATWDVRFFMNS